jgi:hypothetical protein
MHAPHGPGGADVAQAGHPEELWGHAAPSSDSFHGCRRCVRHGAVANRRPRVPFVARLGPAATLMAKTAARCAAKRFIVNHSGWRWPSRFHV